ncbi:MAG TPA: tetratricopeptide repeat protein [Vicinamibacterales bacterium]|nr:tetratricopeptide repeat protein [Vicinamibacterales bacterium]
MKAIRWGVLCGLVLSASPAAAADKTHLQLMAEIRMLQEQSQQLQILLGSLQDALKTVTTKLDEQSAATRKAMADQTLAMNNIGDNVRVLRDKTDETNVRLSTVAQEIDALRQSLASQPAAIPVGTPPGGAPGTEPAAAPPTATAPPPTPTGVSPQRMFDASFDDYSAARYDLAIQGFQGFIQAFPRLPQAADAQYNIGMSYFNQSNWPQARDAFQKTINDYPQATDRVADAYYKLGQTFEMLKQVDNAKRAYETLIQRFPNAFTATQAKNALDRLTKK